jgi:hypothetical protein
MSAVFLTVSKTRGPKRADKTRNGRAAAPFSISRRPCANSKPPVLLTHDWVGFFNQSGPSSAGHAYPGYYRALNFRSGAARCGMVSVHQESEATSRSPARASPHPSAVCLHFPRLITREGKQESVRQVRRAEPPLLHVCLTLHHHLAGRGEAVGPDGRGLFLWLRCLRSFT